MQILADRLDGEAPIILGGTWAAFAVALCLALPQPPNLLYLAIGAVVGGLLVVLGFSAASRCRGLGPSAPSQRVMHAVLSAATGGALGALLLMTLIHLAGREPALHARFAGRLSESWWRPWALGFESAVIEEITFRLCAMSVIAWLVGRLLHRPRAAFGIAVVTSALLFGLAHLPAWLAVTHATPGLVVAVLLLNGAGGLLFGWIFWRWGLPYAVLCHLVADLVVQGLGPTLLA